MQGAGMKHQASYEEVSISAMFPREAGRWPCFPVHPAFLSPPSHMVAAHVCSSVSRVAVCGATVRVRPVSRHRTPTHLRTSPPTRPLPHTHPQGSDYSRVDFVQPLSLDEISSGFKGITRLHHAFGFDTSRRDNLQYVEPGVVLYIAGNMLVTMDLRADPPTRTYNFGVEGRGVGSFVLHPTEPLVVVGEKGNEPNIFIYEYPSWKLVRVLRKGTERSYSSLAFSPDGEKLATVGGFPDFMLTIWDWRKEKISLHTKAFGQDVYKVVFSPDDPGRLTSSGTGHIRFWRMARTFTGLKLQGDIGKFGKVELSDVAAFAELPDGKVLSSTETGALLLWEGNFIKCCVVRPNGGLAHEGPITTIELRWYEPGNKAAGGFFITTGLDGEPQSKACLPAFSPTCSP